MTDAGNNACTGPGVTFDAAYAVYSPWAARRARSVARSFRCDPDDLVQMAMIALWRRLTRYGFDRDDCMKFRLNYAMRQAAREWNHMRRVGRMTANQLCETVAAEIPDRPGRDDALELPPVLSRDTAATVRLLFERGLTQAAAGEILGVDQTTVSNRWTRAVPRLAAYYTAAGMNPVARQ